MMIRLASTDAPAKRPLWPLAIPAMPHQMRAVDTTMPATIAQKGHQSANAFLGGAHWLLTLSDHR